MFNFEKILKKLIKVGIVSQVNYKKGTCKVVFPEKDFQTQELQVITKKTLKHKTFDMPDIDEHVLCVFLPFSENTGFILGSFYTENNQALCSDNRVQYKFEDGTYIEYDKKSKQLTTDVKGNIKAKAQNIISIEAPEIVLKGNITLDGEVNTTKNMTVANIINCKDTITKKGSVNSHNHTGNLGKKTTLMNE